MRLTQPADIIDFDPYTTRPGASATHAAGDLVTLTDGRRFRHGKVGAAAISKGKLQLAPAPKANHAACAVVGDPSLDSTSLTVTLGATAATAGEYNEGFAVVANDTGEGQTYQISSHPAANSGATLALRLFDPLGPVDLDTTSDITLVHNAHVGVVEAASKTRRAAGVPLISVAIGDWAWFQTKGVAGVLIGSAATLGAGLSSDGSTAGAVTDNTDVTAPQTEVIVGMASIQAGTSTNYDPIVLSID